MSGLKKVLASSLVTDHSGLAVHATNATLPQTVTQEQIEAAIYNPGVSAWGSVAGSNGALNGGLNIQSVTRTGVGVYNIVFNHAMPNDDYAVNVTSAAAGVYMTAKAVSKTVTGFTVYTQALATSGVTGGVQVDGDFNFSVLATNALPLTGGTGADAWVETAANGTLGGSFNIASVTKSSTGTYDYVFTTPMPSANYAATAALNDNTYSTAKVINRTTTGFSVVCSYKNNSAGTATNYDHNHSVVIHATNAVLPQAFTEQEIQQVVDLAQRGDTNPGVSAWGSVSSTGALRSGLNVQSVTRTQAGFFDVVFNTPMPTANYAVVVTLLTVRR